MPQTLLKVRDWTAPVGGGEGETPLSPPTGLAVQNTTDQIDLGWTPPTDPRVTSIGIYRATTSTGPWVQVDTVEVAVASWTDLTLQTGQTRYYAITALDATGAESARGAVVQATQRTDSASLFVVEDSYADAPGTPLDQHVGETGATWTRMAAWSDSTAVISNQSRARGTGGSSLRAIYATDGIPDTADYDVIVDVVPIANNSVSRSGPAGRINTSATGETFYHCRYSMADNAWQLFRFLNGTAVQLGPNVAATLTMGVVYEVTLRMRGSAISVLVNGVTLIAASDNGITATGVGGIRFYGTSTDTAGVHLDHFRVLNAADTATDTIPPPAPTGLSATPRSNDILLTWTGSGVADFGHYDVFRATTASGASTRLTPTGGVATATYADANVAAGATYYYRVIETDLSGNESPLSAQVSAVAIGGSGANPNAFVTGTMTLSASFESIAATLTYTGDPNRSASVALDYSDDGGTTWKAALPAWHPIPSADSSDVPEYYGRINLLSPGTTYHVRMTITDPDGVTGSTTVTNSITTRAETITPRASLTPTHYVAADYETIPGTTTNTGTSPSSPWTLAHAWANAPQDAVVKLTPEFHLMPATTRSSRITLLGTNPAVDDNLTIINPSTRSVLEGVRGARPSGSSATGENTGLIEAPWVLIPAGTALPLAAGGTWTTTFDLWKWALSPVANPDYIGYSATRRGLPTRIQRWIMETTWDIGDRAQAMTTDWYYRYGMFAGKANPNDLYLRIPPYMITDGITNPNSAYWCLSSGVLSVNIPSQTIADADAHGGATLRVSGVEMRVGFSGIRLDYLKKTVTNYIVVDHNLFISGLYPVDIRSNESPVAYGQGHVFEHNYWYDTGVRMRPGQDASTAGGGIPWAWIKGGPQRGTRAQNSAISQQGGSQRCVIRYNVVDGLFNGFGTSTSNANRYSGYHTDIYGNTFKNIADDCIEYESGTINLGVWNNRIEYYSVFMTLAPCNYGPIHVWDNVAWRSGSEEVPRSWDSTPQHVHGHMFKIGKTHTQQPIVYFINNTAWTDQPVTTGYQQSNNSTYGLHPLIYSRNNISRAVDTAWNRPNTAWDEDYAWLSSDPAQDGVTVSGTDYITVASVASYRNLNGVGDIINTAGGVTYAFNDAATLDGFFVNPTAGNMTLQTGALAKARGVIVPNIRPAGSFTGAAPDLGSKARLTG